VRLSTQADYAVRAMLELARSGEGVWRRTDEIAAAQRIPPARLAKVLKELARADLVRTQRGQGGGVALARAADRITVLDAYEAVEGPILLCRCRQRPGGCGDDGECETHGFWRAVEERLRQELRSTTFAALAARRHDGTAGRRQAAGR
jgi:Rrf2 family protein